MEISSFELIFKKQSPEGEADRVLQGYFLNITNLEDQTLKFRLDLVTSPITDADRTLAGNAIAFIDTPDRDNRPAMLNGGASAPSFRLSPLIEIPAKGTAKVAVLPSDPFPDPTVPANFEARGHVTLRLPALPVEEPGAFIVARAQRLRPARVLVTPQNRATYFNAAGTINDQTQAGLPTATGAAVMEIPPEPFIFELPPRDDLAERLRDLNRDRINDLSATDLALMLAALEADEADLETLNAALNSAGIGMSLNRCG